MNDLGKKLSTIFAEVSNELSPLLTDLDFDQLSLFNRDYRAYANNPKKHFIENESHVHYKIVENICRFVKKDSVILDVGFFIPVVPIALSKLGYQVYSIEKLELYGHSLDHLINYAQNNYEITVMDKDILSIDIGLINRKFDCIILSAIIEHLNGTPKYLFEQAKILGRNDVTILIEVPNIATFRKRIKFFLFGKPPFPNIDSYYYSEYPFSGHNREYTLEELKFVIEQTNLDILTVDCFNRPKMKNGNIKDNFFNFIDHIAPNKMKQSFLAVAQKR
jgi:hypothetical protein